MYVHWKFYVLNRFIWITVVFLGLILECMLKENTFVVLFNKFIKVPWVPEDIFFLSILLVRGKAGLMRKKITSGHRSTQPHFHVRNQFRIWTGCTDLILSCLQGINNIIMALIGYIEQLDMGVSNQNSELISHMEMRLRTPVTRGYFFPR